MSIVPQFPGVPEPRRDKPAQTSGFETYEEMMHYSLMMANARAYGVFDELERLFSEDIEMVCPSPAGLSPFHGEYVGRDAVIAALKESFQVVRFSNIKPVDIFAEGDTVVMHWRAEAFGLGSDKSITVEGMAQARYRNRQIYHYQNHSDTASMVAMSGFRQVEIDP